MIKFYLTLLFYGALNLMLGLALYKFVVIEKNYFIGFLATGAVFLLVNFQLLQRVKK